MVITEISAQKKKGRYNLFVDNSFYSGIDAETIVKHGLKVGTEIDKDCLEELVVESETRSAFDKLITIISRQLYSKRDIELKLIKYGYNKIAIEQAIKKAEEYGYINDKTYAKIIVDSKKLKSKMEIKNSLFLKGIKQDIIVEQVKDIDEEEETERAMIIAEKYMKNKDSSEKNIAGLYNYLMRRGFNSSSISKVLKRYKIEYYEEG